jgi:hypothetical protein
MSICRTNVRESKFGVLMVKKTGVLAQKEDVKRKVLKRKDRRFNIISVYFTLVLTIKQ